MIDTSRKEFTPSIKGQIFFGVYEGAEIRFIRKYLRGVSHVVELGASLGVTSAHILDVLAPGGKLTCVEANPMLLDALRATVSTAQRKTGREATVVYGAVSATQDGDTDGQAVLAVTSSTLDSRIQEAINPDLAVQTVIVPKVTLPSLIQGLADYALVADIEGAEAAIIAGEPEALSRASRVVIELHATRYRGRAISIGDMTASLVNVHGFRVLEQRGRVLALAR